MARTSDMGLRRDAQPPIPIVIPSWSEATASSSVHRLSATLLLREVGCLARLHERIAGLVGDARQVELEGETLLVAVAALDVHRVDPVERLLGRPDHDA